MTIIKSLFPYVLLFLLGAGLVYSYMDTKQQLSETKWQLAQTQSRLNSVENAYASELQLQAIRESLSKELLEFNRQMNTKLNTSIQHMKGVENEINSTQEGRTANVLNPNIDRVLREYENTIRN